MLQVNLEWLQLKQTFQNFALPLAYQFKDEQPSPLLSRYQKWIMVPIELQRWGYSIKLIPTEGKNIKLGLVLTVLFIFERNQDHVCSFQQQSFLGVTLIWELPIKASTCWRHTLKIHMVPDASTVDGPLHAQHSPAGCLCNAFYSGFFLYCCISTVVSSWYVF